MIFRLSWHDDVAVRRQKSIPALRQLMQGGLCASVVVFRDGFGIRRRVTWVSSILFDTLALNGEPAPAFDLAPTA
jgi:hypothetical protein